MSSSPNRVVVVGGGLAGLAAGLEAADRGAAVTVLERRPRLGGATWSFQRRGIWFDNGQHVFLRCCTAYLAFLERIGSANDIFLQSRLDIPVLRPGAKPGRIRRTAGPAPLHLAPGILTYPHLHLRQRMGVLRAGWALRQLDPDDPSLDEIGFGEWLTAHGQDTAAIDTFWNLVVLPTVNVTAAQASLKLAAKVFVTGLLTEAAAADIGWARVPLSALHGDAARRVLEQTGAQVRTSAAVTGVLTGATGRLEVQMNGYSIEADSVVVAVPHDAVGPLLPPRSIHQQDRLQELGVSPILNVHLVYDRPVTGLPMFAAVGSDVQYVFDRTEGAGLDDGRQCLSISLSAAQSYIGRNSGELVSHFSRELTRLLPAAAEATVTESIVTREHKATFHGAPGTHNLRASAECAIDGVYLAGGLVRHRLAGHHGGGGAQRYQGGSFGGGIRRRRPGCRMSRKPDIPQILERTATLVQPALRAAVDRLAPGLATPARYHFGWADADGRLLSPGRSGKGVRPTLALLSAQAVGAAPEVALPGAVAVELIHNFSLVHDDIVDDDSERRHRATMWKVFGVGDAIIVGDAMMGLALEVLLDDLTPARTAAAADLTRATMAMIAGQYMDMSFAVRDNVDVEECWEMVSRKTGALLAHASAVGAILAGAPEPTVEALRRFGMELGLGFQALDDLLGIWGDPAVTGKPAGNDLRERKMSIPVTVALCSGTTAGEELATLYARDNLSEADLARAASLIEQAGGREATSTAAQERLHSAANALSTAAIESGPAQEMLDLAHFVVNREF